ncbi:spindle checkpoint protein, partial [Thelephora terrestris]
VEVAIHTILYVRRVYPPNLFIRRKKYDTPVFQSRHPALNKYISGAVKAIGEELALGHVDKAIVVIKNKGDDPLERFVFALRNMVEVQRYDKDRSVEDAITPALLGQYFRSFISRLTMLEAQLGVMPTGNDLSFTIVLELNEDSQPSAPDGTVSGLEPVSRLILTRLKDPPPWVPAVKSHTTSATSDDAETHLVRAVNTGIIDIALVVQESEVKLRLLEQEEANARVRQGGVDKGKARMP